MHEQYDIVGCWQAYQATMECALQLAQLLTEKNEDDTTEAALRHVIRSGYLEAPDRLFPARKSLDTIRRQWLRTGINGVGGPTEQEASGHLRLMICFSDGPPPEAAGSTRAAKETLRIQPGFFSREDCLMVMVHQDDERWFSLLERGLTLIYLAHLFHSDSIVDAWSAKLDIMDLKGGDAWQRVLQQECAAIRSDRHGSVLAAQRRADSFYFRNLHAAFGCATQCGHANPYVEDCRRALLSMAARVALDAESRTDRPAAIQSNVLELYAPAHSRPASVRKLVSA